MTRFGTIDLRTASAVLLPIMLRVAMLLLFMAMNGAHSAVAPVVDWHVPAAEAILPAEATFAAGIVPGVIIASFCVCCIMCLGICTDVCTDK